ncbi:PAS domain S-box protein [bacterium]
MIINTSILIIENRKRIAKTMCHSLNQLGYQDVQIAASNHQALKSLKQKSPDIVFMDISLEDNSSTLKATYELVNDRDIPIVYVSSEEEKEIHTKYNDSNGVIIKYSDSFQIKKTIEAALHQHDLEVRLQHTESQFHAMINNINEAVIILDKQGQIISLNQTAQDLFDHLNIILCGQQFEDMFQFKSLSNPKTSFTPMIELQQSSESEIKKNKALVCLPDGISLPIEFSLIQIERSYIFIFRKLGNNSQLEDLRISETKFQSILENAVNGFIFVNMKGTICEVNEALCRMINMNREQLIGKNSSALARKLLKGKDLIRVLSYLKNMFLGKNIEPYELEFNNRIFEIHSPLARGVLGFTVIFNDITEKKQAEEKLSESAFKYKKIFETANDGMIYLSATGHIIDINSRALQTLGSRRSSIIKKHISDLKFISPETKNEINRQFKNALRREKATYSFSILNKHQEKLHLECVSTRITRNKQVEGVLIIARDVTKRIQQENQIRTSLQEKEVLLQEIHHRVKNNLQIISSLLHLQSFQFTDDKILDCIKQSQNRIRTMAILHEQLYHTDDFAHIDFEYYVRTIIRHLMNQFTSTRDRVSIRLNIEQCIVGIENAVYCGLIINELTSNALKYAFPGNTKGNVYITMRRIPNKTKSFELIVQNDGIHMPEDLDIQNTTTLGLRLVRLLSEKQMRGQLQFERIPKTTFKIIFREE